MLNEETVAGIKMTAWPSDLANELKEVKTHVALASIMFSYTLTKVEICLASALPYGSPACAIVHDDRNIICFTRDGFTKFCTSSQQRAFILVHELYHIFFQHHGRCIDMNYHPLIFNYATDYYINLKASGVFLDRNGNRKVDEKYSKHFHRPMEVCVGGRSEKEALLYDERFLGMTADDIYDSIVGEMKKNKNNPSASPIDMSGYIDSDDMGENDSLSDIIGNGGTDSKKRENAQTLAGAATASKMGMNSSDLAGSAEGDMVRLVERMMKPTVRWEDKFENTLRSKIKVRTSYNRWNKMSSVGNGVIFPSYIGERVNLVYGVDSSGSMTENAHREAYGELYGLLESLDGWVVSVASCDADVTEVGTFSNEDGDSFEDISFKMAGLGGTYLSPLLDYADKINDDMGDVNAIIIVTDGYFDGSELYRAILERGDAIPVIVIVVRDGDQSFTMNNAEVIFVN